jgi:predicted HicB family RNase H-like nuclease
MRINYEIPDELHHQAKATAALEGKTLRGFVVEALEEAVQRRQPPGQQTRPSESSG